MPETPNPIMGTIFGDAWQAGALEGSELGPFTFWYPDLQVTHVLQSTGYETYTDMVGPRVPRHLLVYGPSGWWKSSSTKRYLTEAIGAEEPDDTAQRGENPIMFMLEGSSSYESLRGSSDAEGHLVRPFFACIDYLFSSELFAFLGNDSGRQQDMVDKIGRVLEERDMRVRLIKLQNLELSNDDQEWLHQYNVNYNPREGVLSYEAKCVMIACSHFFDEEEKKIIETRGFDDRMFYSTWRGTSEQIMSVKDHGGWIPGASDPIMDRIKDFNNKLERCTFESLPAPPRNMVNEVHDHIWNNLMELVTDGGVTPTEALSGRDWLICYQLLTAAAIERTVRNLHDPGLGPLTIPTLNYTQEDIDVALFFANRYVYNRFHEMRQQVEMDDYEWQNAHRLKSVVDEIGGSSMESGEILDVCMKNFTTELGTPMSRRSSFRLINDWLDRRWIDRVSRGVYEVTQKGSEMMEAVQSMSINHARNRGGNRDGAISLG